MADVTSRGRGPGTSDITVSTMVAQEEDPIALTDKAQIYSKVVDSVIEVFVMDSAGNPVKLSG